MITLIKYIKSSRYMHTASVAQSVIRPEDDRLKRSKHVALYNKIVVLTYINLCFSIFLARFRWSRGSVLAFNTQVPGFKPGRSRRIFRAKKSSARLPSEGK